MTARLHCRSPRPGWPSGLFRVALMPILMSILTLSLLLPASPVPAADTLSGEYIKDQRDYYETGLVCRLEAQSLSKDRLKVVLSAVNPALCGFELEGEVQLKGNAGVFREQDCLKTEPAENCDALNLRFAKDRVTVEGDRDDNGPGGINHCSLNGTYTLYGAMVEPVAQIIKNIRRHYYKTNEIISEFDVVHLDVDNLVLEAYGFTTDATRLTIYKYREYPKKIVVVHTGSKGEVTEEYYYFDNQLLFCFRQTRRDQGGTLGTAEENRFYFHQGRLIRWLDRNKKKVPASDPRFAAEQERIVLLSSRYAGMSEMEGGRVDWNSLGDL